MNQNLILQFLYDLEQNNCREWFHDHKQQYQAANGIFEELVETLILELKKSDPTVLLTEPGKLTFKLVRDTRFSNDKSPYLPAFRAHISAKGKLPIPVGYYLMLRPGGRSFLGGGLFADMFRDATAMVRAAIADRGEEWQEILSATSFTERFIVKGNALKKVPYGFDPNHPQAEYLKNKSWYLEYPIADEELSDPQFVQKAVGVYQAMQPFNNFLNQALEQFQMPARS